MFTTNPDYVNEKGTQWWFSQEVTDKANEKDENENRLLAVGYFIKEEEGSQAWVLVDVNSEIIEFEATKEEIYDRIVCRKLALNINKKFFLPPTHAH